jgi:hypothetical protein
MANVFVVDATGNHFLNLLLLDSSRTAMPIRQTGGSLAIFDNFDATVPEVDTWGSLFISDLFVDEGEGEILAGTYHMFWAVWNLGAGGWSGWRTAFAIEYTFEAGKTYLITVENHGTGFGLGDGVYTIEVLTEVLPADFTALDAALADAATIKAAMAYEWEFTQDSRDALEAAVDCCERNRSR